MSNKKTNKVVQSKKVVSSKLAIESCVEDILKLGYSKEVIYKATRRVYDRIYQSGRKAKIAEKKTQKKLPKKLANSAKINKKK